MQVQGVTGRVPEDRLVADAAVDRVHRELDTLRLERLARGVAVGSITASVRLPAWNSAAGLSPQRLTNGSPSTVP